MKKKTAAILFAIFAFFLALGITLYPVVSTAYNERHQSEIHTAYQELVDKTDHEAIAAEKAKAIAYNEAILPGTQETDAFSQEALLGAAEEYADLLNLAGDGIMGYVKIPAIGINLPIYHGTGDATLEKGVGHLLGSSLPVGGDSTHTILTAHSGMASQKMFSDLNLASRSASRLTQSFRAVAQTHFRGKLHQYNAQKRTTSFLRTRCRNKGGGQFPRPNPTVRQCRAVFP